VALTIGGSLSPFSASPQQHANAAASPADEVFGLGALAYELLGGLPAELPGCGTRGCRPAAAAARDFGGHAGGAHRSGDGAARACHRAATG
jgi:hypothetical protein